jgi:hypothetical protein
VEATVIVADPFNSDPALQVHPDPDTGFADQKIEKKMNYLFFIKKNCSLLIHK